MLQSSFRRSATSRPPPTKADPDCRHRFNVARAEEPKIRRTLKFTRNELWKFAQGRREEGSCQEAVSRAGKDIKKARTQEIHLATSASCLSSFCSRAGIPDHQSPAHFHNLVAEESRPRRSEPKRRPNDNSTSEHWKSRTLFCGSITPWE